MIAALVLSVTFLAAAIPSSAMFGPLDVGNDIDYDSGWDSGGNDYDGGWSWGDSGTELSSAANCPGQRSL